MKKTALKLLTPVGLGLLASGLLVSCNKNKNNPTAAPAFSNICARPDYVKSSLLAATATTKCAAVSNAALAKVETLTIDPAILALPGDEVARKANFTTLTSNDLRGLSNLKVLIIRNTRLSAIAPATFTVTPQLKELDLSSNAFKNLPAESLSKAGIKTLNTLNISYNHLEAPTVAPVGAAPAVAAAAANTGFSKETFKNLTSVEKLVVIGNVGSAKITAADLQLNPNVPKEVITSTAELTAAAAKISAGAIPAKKAEIAAVQKEIADLKALIDTAALKKTEGEITANTKLLADLDVQLTKATNELNKLTSELAVKEKTILPQKKNVADTRAAREELTAATTAFDKATVEANAKLNAIAVEKQNLDKAQARIVVLNAPATEAKSVAAARKANSDAVTALTKLEATTAAVSAQITGAKADLTVLEKLTTDTKTVNFATRTTQLNTDLAAKVAAVTAAENALKAELAKVKTVEAKADLKTKLTTLNTAKATASAELLKLTIKIEGAKATVANLKAAKQEVKGDADQKKAIEKSNAELDKAIVAQEKVVKDEAANLTKAKATADDADKKLADLAKEIAADNNAQLIAIEAEVNKKQAVLASAITAREEVKNQMKELALLKSKHDVAAPALATKTTMIAELEKTLAANTTAITAQKTALPALEANVTALETERNTLLTSLATLPGTIKTLGNEREAALVVAMNAEAKKIAADKKAKDLNTKFGKFVTEADAIDLTTVGLRAKIKGSTDDLTIKKNERTVLVTKIADLRKFMSNTVSEKRAQITLKTAQLELLQTQLNAIEAEVKRMQAAAVVKAEQDKLEQKAKELKEMIEKEIAAAKAKLTPPKKP